MSGFVIRAFRDADMAALLDVWVESWQATCADIDFEARRGWFTDYFAALRSGGARVFTAECDGALAGFITINPVSNDIDQFAVDPAHFGGGLGAQLLAAAKDVSPHRLTLKVNQGNARALRFYEREGFERTGDGVNTQSGRAFWEMKWKKVC